MRKILSFRALTVSLIAITAIITTISAKADSPLATRLSGKILLQVEDNGKAWYVSPNNDNQRIYLGSPAEAHCLMKTLGLGISNIDLNKYLNTNTNKFPAKLSGKILLAVEQHGEGYYISPDNLRGYYLGKPSDAFNLMRELSLGITNANLETISVLDNTEMLNNCNLKNQDQEETSANISLVTNPIAPMINFSHIVSVSATIINPDNIFIKERGLLYDFAVIPNISLSPTLDRYNQRLVSEINLNNTYTIDLANLIPGSYPFIRSYAVTNDNQVIYGNIVNITGTRINSLPNLPAPSSRAPSTPDIPPAPIWACGDPITDDRDDNVYNTVQIEDQCWLQENLAYLPEVHSNAQFATQGNGQLPGYGVYGYDGSDVTIAKAQPNYSDYGVLYNWYAVSTTTNSNTNLCPDGWHVPDNSEAIALLSSQSENNCTLTGWRCSPAGSSLKSSGTEYWEVGNTGTNISGFSLRGGGYRWPEGGFNRIKFYGTLWLTSSLNASSAFDLFFYSPYSTVNREGDLKRGGFSVRCLKTE